MRVLLTGCTGFIGSVLGPRLEAAGHDLFCVCRSDKSPSFGKPVVWDGAEPIECFKFPESVDAVIHLAQSRSYRHFPADSREMFEVNVVMTMRLLEWAARSRVKQFCLGSSGAVYEPFDRPLREDSALAPTGFLGASKLASEIIARPFSSILAVNILRLFFPYGPGQRDRLLPELIHRIRSGAAIQVSGNREGVRLVPTFVEDVVEVILASIQSCWTDTLNVATPEILSIGEIANTIGRHLEIEPKFEITDESPRNIIPNLDRLASRFDLSRFTRFDEGLRKTLSEESEHRTGAI